MTKIVKNTTMRTTLVRLGLSAIAAADKAGVSRTTVNLMVAGGRVRRSTVEYIAGKLGVTAVDLGYDSPDKMTPKHPGSGGRYRNKDAAR